MDTNLQTINTATDIIPVDLGPDSHRKREYIKWRVCGFSPAEARDYTGVAQVVVDTWFADEQFMTVMERLLSMADQVADEILKQEELKNRLRVSQIDAKALDLAMKNGVGQLDDKTFDYVKQAKKSLEITPDQRAALNLTVNNIAPKSVNEMLAMVEEDHAAAEAKRRKGLTGTESKDVQIIEGSSKPIDDQESTVEPIGD